MERDCSRSATGESGDANRSSLILIHCVRWVTALRPPPAAAVVVGTRQRRRRQPLPWRRMVALEVLPLVRMLRRRREVAPFRLRAQCRRRTPEACPRWREGILKRWSQQIGHG